MDGSRLWRFEHGAKLQNAAIFQVIKLGEATVFMGSASWGVALVIGAQALNMHCPAHGYAIPSLA